MNRNPITPIHIIGRRHHGKTTLIVELISLFVSRGIRVGTIKHSKHDHELDTKGKASCKHREAGANPAAIITRGLSAIYLPRELDDDPYVKLLPLYNACDLVLVEGDIERKAIKIEVWRKEMDTTPIASERDDIRAIITDDLVDLSIPIWPRSDLARIADEIVALGLVSK
jgi:molybdopterin-guanine dinucleotide biosynthesis adapter protein